MSTEQATLRRSWLGRREVLVLIVVAGLALAAVVPAVLRAAKTRGARVATAT